MASGALIGGDDNSNKNNNTVTDNNNGGGGNNGSRRHRWGESKVYMRKGSSKSLKVAPSQTLAEEANSSLHAGRFDAASDDSSSLSRKPTPMNREPTPNGVSHSPDLPPSLLPFTNQWCNKNSRTKLPILNTEQF